LQLFVSFERSLARRAIRTAFARDVSTETKISKMLFPNCRKSIFQKNASMNFWQKELILKILYRETA
jgi:hypothetical protein